MQVYLLEIQTQRSEETMKLCVVHAGYTILNYIRLHYRTTATPTNISVLDQLLLTLCQLIDAHLVKRSRILKTTIKHLIDSLLSLFSPFTCRIGQYRQYRPALHTSLMLLVEGVKTSFDFSAPSTVTA